MTPLARIELEYILASHALWLAGNPAGVRADLTDADLRYTVLWGADLRYANLRGANLRGAILPTGEMWETYIGEVVPALCVAGGATLAEVAEHWDCHNWANCPMAVAFGVHDLDEIPALFRPRAEQFVQLFDAGLIPNPLAATSDV